VQGIPPGEGSDFLGVLEVDQVVAVVVPAVEGGEERHSREILFTRREAEDGGVSGSEGGSGGVRPGLALALGQDRDGRGEQEADREHRDNPAPCHQPTARS